MLRAMRSRSLNIAVLVFTAAWFAVVLPGHQRGVVKLPGADASPGYTSGPQCALCEWTGGEPGANDDAPPSRRPAPSHCALCQLIAVLDAPPITNLDAPVAGLAEVLTVSLPDRTGLSEPPHVYLGRAPPLSA